MGFDADRFAATNAPENVPPECAKNGRIKCFHSKTWFPVEIYINGIFFMLLKKSILLKKIPHAVGHGALIILNYYHYFLVGVLTTLTTL